MFEVCVRWGEMLEMLKPVSLVQYNQLIEDYGIDGPADGYWLTGCGRAANPNPYWIVNKTQPNYGAYYFSATQWGTNVNSPFPLSTAVAWAVPHTLQTAVTPSALLPPSPGWPAWPTQPHPLAPSYIPSSGFWGGGVFLHCVKFDGRKPTIGFMDPAQPNVPTDIGQWVDFTQYAGFDMWLRVCEIGTQCSYTNSQLAAVTSPFGGLYDFPLHANPPPPWDSLCIDSDMPTPIILPPVPHCKDTLSCPCGWTPVYDHPVTGELSCESPNIGTLDAPQTFIIPAIESKCLILEDYSVLSTTGAPMTVTPQVHMMWENQPVNPALWNQLAWDKVWIVELSIQYSPVNINIETRAFLPCDIPSYNDPWPLPLTPVIAP